MIEARPAKPPGRRRSGVAPAIAATCASRGSCRISARTPASISAWVSRRWIMVTRRCPLFGIMLLCRARARAVGVFQRPRGVKKRNRTGSPRMMPTFRFAPSPNGYLHLGHAFSALLNFDLARESGGRFLLRIEDIDATRCRPDYETAIYEDLAWLGLAWETPVRRQSEHLSVYREAVEKLSGRSLIYPAFESRAEIARLVAERETVSPWPRDPDGTPLYPGAAKSFSAAARRQ